MRTRLGAPYRGYLPPRPHRDQGKRPLPASTSAVHTSRANPTNPTASQNCITPDAPFFFFKQLMDNRTFTSSNPHKAKHVKKALVSLCFHKTRKQTLRACSFTGSWKSDHLRTHSGGVPGSPAVRICLPARAQGCELMKNSDPAAGPLSLCPETESPRTTTSLDAAQEKLNKCRKK